jgi:hypothetical protein
MEVFPKRFAQYGLESNAGKPQLVACGRPQGPTSGRPLGTCTLLGFGHYWGKPWRGGYPSKRQTEGKRLRRPLGECWRWGRDTRPRPLQAQYATLWAQRRGDYPYDGMRCHRPCLDLVDDTAMRAWRYGLHRRGGRQRTGRAVGRKRAA